MLETKISPECRDDRLGFMGFSRPCLMHCAQIPEYDGDHVLLSLLKYQSVGIGAELL